MSNAVLTGRATIFGFIGDIAFTGAGTFVKNSGEVTDEFGLTELTDDLNDPITLVASGQKKKFKFQFTPIAASGTNTLANAAGSLAAPAMLAAVTLTNFKAAAVNAATWVYVGGWKLAFEKGGLATYELEIMKGEVNDLSTNRTVIS
jgi:hypothetical protein